MRLVRFSFLHPPFLSSLHFFLFSPKPILQRTPFRISLSSSFFLLIPLGPPNFFSPSSFDFYSYEALSTVIGDPTKLLFLLSRHTFPRASEVPSGTSFLSEPFRSSEFFVFQRQRGFIGSDSTYHLLEELRAFPFLLSCFHPLPPTGSGPLLLL